MKRTIPFFPTEQSYQNYLRKRGGTAAPSVQTAPALVTTADHARLLWRQLIDAQVPGPWYFEHYFSETRNWRIDVAAPELKIGIEVDGAAHRIKNRYLDGLPRHNALMFAGWTYLRVLPSEVRSGEALALVQAFLAGRKEGT